MPLSLIAFEQIQDIEDQMNNGNRTESEKYIWSYSAQGSKFKALGAYNFLKGHQVIEPAFKWMWKSRCQQKHRVFFWLLLMDRLSTRNILRRRNMILETYDCEFCINQQEESTQHLFWDCPFAQQCWGIIHVQTIHNGSTFHNIEAIKDQLQSQFSMIATILMCWTIWKARNEVIFNNNQPT
jgi:hypothetical protein